MLLEGRNHASKFTAEFSGPTTGPGIWEIFRVFTEEKKKKDLVMPHLPTAAVAAWLSYV